ncbi:MAG: TonB-dependent receptor [Gemmatimonadota bacterium]
MRLIFALSAAMLTSLVPARAHAQTAVEGTARIQGSVRGRGSLRPLAAEVRIIGTDTLVLRADPQGAWRTPALPYGSYRIRVRMPGYAAHDERVTLDGSAGSAATLRRSITLDETAVALDQVVVTAARRSQRLKDAVTSVEVITRADIVRSGGSDLATALLQRTGIALQGGHPSGTGVMLQGIGSERVLVLLDGQPVSGRISGVFDVSRIPAEMVERVEVIKGSQSALYGTDAMGGVINIITRAPMQGSVESAIGLTMGTQARRDGSARVSGGRRGLLGGLDVSRRGTETTPGRNALNGALTARTDLAAKIRWSGDSTRAVRDSGTRMLHSIELSGLSLDERQRWRSGTLFAFADNRQWNARVAGTVTRGAHRLAPTFSASSFDHLSRSSVLGKPIAGDTGQRQRQRVLQGELLYNGRVGPNGVHALDVGTIVRRDETETERVRGGLRSITSVEPFAQLEVAFSPAFTAVSGVRVTRSSQWGTHVTPRVALRHHVTPSVTVRASAGEGFRAPDFKELFMVFQNQNAGYAVLGNAMLQPETSRNASVGADWNGAGSFVRGNLFYNRYRNFIETQAISGSGEAPVYQYGNIDDGTTAGVELETGTTFGGLGGLRVDAAYNGLVTRDAATGQPLLGRPAHSARLSVGVATPWRGRLNVAGAWTGRTPMERDGAARVTGWRDGFLRTDARLTLPVRALHTDAQFLLGADNLFDRRPAQWAGYTGRHLFTGFSWTLHRNVAP